MGDGDGLLFDVNEGRAAATFATMKQKFGVWPLTVWELDHQDQLNKAAIEAIGDKGTVRAGSSSSSYWHMGERKTTRKEALGHVSPNSVYRVETSIFQPSLCQWILNMYAPEKGTVYDPFAGGGTRAILSAKRGLKYIGCEIRQEEVDAVKARCAANGVADLVTLHCADSKNPPVEEYEADFIITCPPYYDMETYGGGGEDLSMAASYSEFLAGMGKVVEHCRRIAKRNAYAVWVVGLHRSEQGTLYPLNHDIARLHRDAGWRLMEEAIMVHKNNGAIQRVGNFDKGHGHLIRIHEYVLVFKA